MSNEKIEINVGVIVKKYLEENKYDGLYFPGECACTADDLAPCGQIGINCKTGYKSDCEPGCNCGVGGMEGAWHIGDMKG